MAESIVEDEVVIEAPVGEVWAAIKEPARHEGWHPYVTRIEGEHRLGAIRSCSVIVGNKAGQTTERCIEDEDERSLVWAIEEDSTGFARMVAGWHAGFNLEPAGVGTRVIARSVYQPKTVLLRIGGPLVKRKFHQAQRSILAGLKEMIETGVSR